MTDLPFAHPYTPPAITARQPVQASLELKSDLGVISAYFEK